MLKQGVKELIESTNRVLHEWPKRTALPEEWYEVLEKISDLKTHPSYDQFREDFSGQNVLVDFDYWCKVADIMHRSSNQTWIAIRNRVEQSLGLVVIMEWGDSTPADPVIHRSYVDVLYKAAMANE